MRTTLDLDPVLLSAARQLAAHRSVSLGRAISELALKGLGHVSEPMRTANGFPVFKRSAGAPAISLEDVKRHLDDEV